MNKILVCTGFHRSASSATARYLNNAGLTMGIHFMGGGMSNFGGHYEDWPVVRMHDRLLQENNTSWQFHDEVALETQTPTPFLKYIQLRDQYASSWGFKDPRSILFLNEWDETLRDRGRYLFLVRHWSSSIESLLRRRNRRLSHSLSTSKKDINFWSEPDLGARMWLAYNRRLLSFAAKKPDQCLIITQRALFNDIPLIETLNNNFSFQLDQGTENLFDSSQINDYASNSVKGIFAEGVRDQLEDTWSRLLDMAAFKNSDESPMYRDEVAPKKHFIQKLSTTKIEEIEVKKYSQGNVKDKNTLLEKIKSAKSADEVSDLLHEDRTQQQTKQREDVASLINVVSGNYKTSKHVNLAFAYWLKSNDEWDKAIKYFQYTLQLELELASTYLNMAQCYESLSESNLADKFFKKAISSDPDNPLFSTIYGAFLRDIGKTDDALNYFKRGAELAKEKPSCVLPYCEMLEQSDRIKQAQELVMKLSEANPNNLVVMNMLIRLNLKTNSSYGEQLYKNMVKTQINAKGHRYEWLAKICKGIAVKSAKVDFISRVNQSWNEVDLD